MASPASVKKWLVHQNTAFAAWTFDCWLDRLEQRTRRAKVKAEPKGEGPRMCFMTLVAGVFQASSKVVRMVRQVSVEGGVMRRNGRLTSEDKLRFLSREWGYAEITKVILALSGDQKFLVKNYRGKLPADWNTGDPLPGNPRATRMIEVTAYSEQRALHAAYWKTLTSKEKGNGSSRPKALTTQFLKV